eukprot:m.69400 g.69400  ORF g.69400 m.69400 type:complete len:71 (+) comp14123_c0_seq1:644-856(+)
MRGSAYSNLNIKGLGQTILNHSPTQLQAFFECARQTMTSMTKLIQSTLLELGACHPHSLFYSSLMVDLGT